MTRRPFPTVSTRRATRRLLACTGAALALAAIAAGAAPAAIPAAPGGPILVVTSNGDSFGSYLPEILRGEGLNEFDVADIGSVGPQTLAAHDVVVLGHTSLSDAQVAMFSAWVQGGGQPRRHAPRQEARGAARPGGRRRHARRGEPHERRGRRDRREHALPRQRRPLRAGRREPGRHAGQRAARGDAARRRRRRRAGRGLHLRPRALGGLHAAGQPRVGRHGARRQRRGDPLRRHVLRRHATRLGRPQPRPGPGRRRAAADAGQPRHRHGERPHAAAALLVPAARPEGGRRPHGRRPQLQPGRHQRAVQPLPGRQPARLLGRAVAVRALDLLPLPGHLGLERPGGGLPGPGLRDRAAPLGLGQPRRAGVGRRQLPQLPEPVSRRQRPRRAAAGLPLDLPEHRRAGEQPQPLHHLQRLVERAATPSSGRASASTPTTTTGPTPWVPDRPGFFTGSGFPQRFAETDGSLIDVYQAATQLTDESGQDIARRGHGSCSTTRSARPGSTASSRPTCIPTTPTAPAPTRSSPPPRRAECPIVSARQMLTWLDGRNASSFQGCRLQRRAADASASRQARRRDRAAGDAPRERSHRRPARA